ncbi:MAG: FadR family transcriptional regulator, partial [Thermomicrobiales bacterium]|nr:FadR family transcriptional regulator [Thermomicrobiales bacterium]
LKVLAAQGLVESRQGSGLYVRNRPIESVSRAITLSVSPDLMSVDRLFEFRKLLEMDAARLATVRATSEQIAELESTVAGYQPAPDGGPNWDSFAPVDNALHAQIAEAAGNPFLAVMVESVRTLMQDIVPLIADHPGSIDEAMRQHHAIRAAIAAGDAEGAARAMGEHVDYTSQVVHIQAESLGQVEEQLSGTSLSAARPHSVQRRS